MAIEFTNGHNEETDDVSALVATRTDPPDSIPEMDGDGDPMNRLVNMRQERARIRAEREEHERAAIECAEREKAIAREGFESVNRKIAALEEERALYLSELGDDEVRLIQVPAPKRTARRQPSAPPVAAKATEKPKTQRAPRRNAEDIQSRLDDIARALKPGPMSAGEICTTLGIDQKKEFPRIIREGLEQKRWRADGKARGTKYSLVSK